MSTASDLILQANELLQQAGVPSYTDTYQHNQQLTREIEELRKLIEPFKPLLEKLLYL